MDWTTLSAGVLVIGGAIATAWQWVRSRTPKAVDIVNDVINRLQGEGQDGVPTRLDALEHAEALYRYLESKGNPAGIEAIQLLVAEIMTPKKGS